MAQRCHLGAALLFCLCGLWVGFSGPARAQKERVTIDPAALQMLRNDPGLAKWFSGVIRVEQAGERQLLIAQGEDGAGRTFSEDSMFWLGSV